MCCRNMPFWTLKLTVCFEWGIVSYILYYFQNTKGCHGKESPKQDEERKLSDGIREGLSCILFHTLQFRHFWRPNTTTPNSVLQHSSTRFNSGVTRSMKNFLPPQPRSSLPELTMHSLYPICIFITVYKATMYFFWSVSPIRLEAI